MVFLFGKTWTTIQSSDVNVNTETLKIVQHHEDIIASWVKPQHCQCALSYRFPQGLVLWARIWIGPVAIWRHRGDQHWGKMIGRGGHAGDERRKTRMVWSYLIVPQGFDCPFSAVPQALTSAPPIPSPQQPHTPLMSCTRAQDRLCNCKSTL